MKTRQRQPVRKADEETTDDKKPAATHRLTGIAVKEVSIVERGANQRSYLVVKQDEPLAKDVPVAPPPAPPTAPTPPTPQTLQISPELKAKVLQTLQTAQERIGVIQKVLEGASETPGAPPPQELTEALTGIATLFTAPKPPETQPTPTVTSSAGKSDEVAKAGRKMSAQRLAQLQSARDSISAIIEDVTSVSEGETEESAEKPAETQTEAAKAANTPTPAPSPELEALRTTVQGLVGSVEKMTSVFQGQHARLNELTKSRGSSQQLELDGPQTSRKPEVVKWDMDMASPLKAVL